MKKILFFILTILAIIYWHLFDFLRKVEFDSPSYIANARLLWGIEGGSDFQSRISKPIPLILPGFFEKFFNINPQYIFILQNLLLFYICAFLIYQIVYKITYNNKLAFWGALIYVTSQPFAIFSLFVLTDIFGWFWGILSISLTIKFFLSKKLDLKNSVLISVLTAVGLFAKESAIVGFIFLCFIILFDKKNYRYKIKTLALCVISFTITYLIGELILTFFYEKSIFKRLTETRDYYGLVYYNLTNIKQIARVFDVYWLLFILVLKQIKEHVFVDKNPILLSCIASIILIIVFSPIHPFICDRILFMFAPFVIIILSYGLLNYIKQLPYLVVIGAILNVGVSYLIYKYNLNNILIISYLLYLLFIILILVQDYRKKKFI